MGFIVAIDGPSGAGKGTITSKIAEKFNLTYIDTGATYRCVTLELLQKNIQLNDIEGIKKVLNEIKIEFENIPLKVAKKIEKNNKSISKVKVKLNQEDINNNENPSLSRNINTNNKTFSRNRVYLNGKDVTERIRQKDVNENVSQVSHILEVRMAMVNLQRRMAEGKDAILEGRDIATNVFPNANVKIYLDASVEERVRRRIAQNKEKHIEMSEEEVKKNIETRDYNDKTSKIGPLVRADDAIYIDSSDLTINQVVNKISNIVKKEYDIFNTEKNVYIMTKETPVKKIRRSFLKHLWGFLYRIVYRVKINKEYKYNDNEAYVICANHLSTMDALGILVTNKRKIQFVAKMELFHNKILFNWAHVFDIIPVRRNSADINSVKLCLKALKNNAIVGIFPEGMRHGLEKNATIKNGAALLAYKANVKVIPVGIKSSFKPFTKVEYNYGKPIDVREFKTDDPNWIDNASKHIMDEIIRLSGNKN